jgi:hypothetical protein
LNEKSQNNYRHYKSKFSIEGMLRL